jgi:transglutaminase-like putative cysteine protease
MIHYLEQTKLLNYNHSAIQDLIRSRQWSSLSVKNQIRSVYNYVRDEIEFGYNRRDDIPASEVLQDVYGQCNTKGILFMALLRALGIPCRIHGFTIHKQLQKGAMNSWYYRLSPDEIIHSWIEVMYKGDWLNMEVFVLFCFVLFCYRSPLSEQTSAKV